MATLNEPNPQGTGSGSDPRHQDTILGDKQAQTRLSERVLALENIKTAQNLEITNLKKRVKKLEKKKKARTSQLKRRFFKVRIESSADKSLETQGRYGHDFEVNTASTSITTASAPVTTAGVSVSTVGPKKSKEKGVSSETTIRPTRGVIMKEASETVTRPIVPPQQQLDPKDKGKAEYEEEERVARQREEEDNLTSWDNTQAMMEADYKLAQRLKAEEHGELTIEERSKLFWVDSFVPMDSEVVEGSKSQTEGNKKRTRKELDEESVKRQKLEDDAEKAELKSCLEIVLGDVVTIKSLATKYPLVD
ncbi:hypothetical protein Tco_1369153 [Tanacetum coccineum]